MNIKEQAKLFAINAHMGQVRKNEPDKPMIIHPISVGTLLEEYGYDDAVVAAGYLHDVVEDTKYTIDDIEKKFGKDIANLVMSASEPDKSLSWMERKTHTIHSIKNEPLRNKLVVCADKINNLEDLMLKFEKSGIRDFSAFKEGEDRQKWYYTSVYKSLVYNENENLPIFKRLKEVLDIVFFEKEDLYLKDVIFDDNKEYYDKLKKLHAQKVELQRLKALCSLAKPFVIEFSGTPRTGKTTTINNLYDFFKKGGFRTVIIEEFTTSEYYKKVFKEKYKELSSEELNMKILEQVTNQLKMVTESENEVVIIDRSINDRQIWNYRGYIHGNIEESKYNQVKETSRILSKEQIDFLAVTYADPLISLKRDYNCSLALEKRNFLNIENIKEYNDCLESLSSLFESSVEKVAIFDTTSMDLNDVSVEVASEILPVMRKKYIKSFIKKYDLN